MKLEIKGEEALYNRFQSLTKVMQKTFWGLVRTDLQDTLLKNVRPHHVTGKLERNVYAKKIDEGVEGGIRNDGMLVSWRGLKVNYAVFVNSGSRPHTIEAKDKKSLRWAGVGGRFNFAKKVHHPGYAGSHFIEKSAKEVFSRLDDQFTKALKSDNVI